MEEDRSSLRDEDIESSGTGSEWDVADADADDQDSDADDADADPDDAG